MEKSFEDMNDKNIMEKYPIVSISLINYNGKKFVIKAIESAVNQDYPNLEIIITDNNSTDGTREEIENNLPEWEEKRRKICLSYYDFIQSKEVDKSGKKQVIQEQNVSLLKGTGGALNLTESKSTHPFIPSREGNVLYASSQEGNNSQVKNLIYIKNKDNTGFGQAHNAAMRIAKGEFVLLLNYDAILTADYIKNVIKPFFEDEKIGSTQGKLLRFDFDKNEPVKNKDDSKFNVIDTTGLLMFKSRRIVCIGQGEADRGQFEKQVEIFGVDGAVPVYRKKALEDTKMPIITNYEFFDENFFMYKEDVDLAWRMKLYGWKAVYTPRAIAYHARGSGDSTAKNYLDIIKERRKINNKAKYLSFKHQRLMQIKNDFPSLLFTKHFFSFIIKEIGSWGYMAIFERFTIQVLKDFARDVPIFLKKRKIIMARKRVGAKEMEKWFK